MLEDQFNRVISEQISRSSVMLQNKNNHYNPDSDKLRAFKVAATIKGESTRNALAGMMVKHTTSIFDMCASDYDYDMEVWNEKITDHINYLLLLRAVVEESKPGMDDVADAEDAPPHFAWPPAQTEVKVEESVLVQHNFAGTHL